MESTLKGSAMELADTLQGAQTIEVNGTKILVLPNGRTAVDLTKYMEAAEYVAPVPTRRRGTFVASDIDSLMRWATQHAPSDKPMFAAGLEKLGNPGLWKKPELSLQVIGNYSTPIEANRATPNSAWHDFVGIYRFPISEQWNAWASNDASPLGQGEFATWIEERMADLAKRDTQEPVADFMQPLLEGYGADCEASPNKMLELSRGLALRVGATVKAAIRLESGEGEVAYVEEHTDSVGGKLKVPSLFWIRIPVFLDSAPVLTGVRLRYRVDNGKVRWSYHMYNPQLTVAVEFKRQIAVAEAAGRSVFYGSPDLPPPPLRIVEQRG